MEIKRNTLMMVAIGTLFLIALFLTYQASSITGNTTSSNAIDTRGWTDNEIMNYEMHGTIPARIGNDGASTTSGGMVGGC